MVLLASSLLSSVVVLQTLASSHESLIRIVLVAHFAVNVFLAIVVRMVAGPYNSRIISIGVPMIFVMLPFFTAEYLDDYWIAFSLQFLVGVSMALWRRRNPITTQA